MVLHEALWDCRALSGLAMTRYSEARDDFIRWDSMVELTGIEPATSGVQNRRSPD